MSEAAEQVIEVPTAAPSAVDVSAAKRCDMAASVLYKPQGHAANPGSPDEADTSQDSAERFKPDLYPTLEPPCTKGAVRVYQPTGAAKPIVAAEHFQEFSAANYPTLAPSAAVEQPAYKPSGHAVPPHVEMPSSEVQQAPTMPVELEVTVMSERAGYSVPRASSRWKRIGGQVRNAVALSSSLFEDSVKNARMGVRSPTKIEPVAAFHCHYKLGALWQHGEVLIAYRIGEAYCLDVFDRIGEAKVSAMKAALLSSTFRNTLRPHYVRAFKASAERGFLLQRRYCHDMVDLCGVSTLDVHAAVSDVVRIEHGKGFSYVRGAHCQAFSNVLFRRLHQLRPPTDQMVELTICGSMCSPTTPRLGALLSDLAGVFEEMHADLRAQEAAARRDGR